MSYHRDRKRNRKKIFFLSIFIIAVVVLIATTPVTSSLSGVLHSVGRPVWVLGDRLSGVWDGIRATVTSKEKLLAENEKLKEDIESFSLKLLDRSLLYEENLELKEMLKRDISPYLILSSVLAGPGKTLYDTLIIDIGENAGVRAGDIVLYGGSVVIGEVEEAYDRTSKVKLLSSPGNTVDVALGQERIPVAAVGKGGGNFEIEVPRDTEVVVGDTVVLPGIVPQIMGTIEYIEVKPNDPFKKLLFKSPVNPYQIKWVEVKVSEE